MAHNRQLLKILADAGLNETQGNIYLAALQAGAASIQTLASRAQVKRTTVYSHIDELVELGLLISDGKGWKRRYIPADPGQLKSLMAHRLDALEQSLPEFQRLYSASGNYNAITRHDGTAAIRRLYNELLESTQLFDFYYVMSDLDRWLALDPKFFTDFVKRRAKKNPHYRLLAIPSDAALERRRSGEAIRFLPETMSVNVNMIITPTFVVLHQMVAPVGAVVLHGRPVVEVQKQIFDVLWQCGLDPLRKPLASRR